MFIGTLLKGLPRSSGAKCIFWLPNVSLLRSLEEWPGRLAYKHLVPLGPKTTAKNKDRSVNEPLETRH
jgi:hypothetical protein